MPELARKNTACGARPKNIPTALTLMPSLIRKRITVPMSATPNCARFAATRFGGITGTEAAYDVYVNIVFFEITFIERDVPTGRFAHR